MVEREMLTEITRQALLIGTSCLTDPTGHIGYKTEVVQASALIRIAEALEAQNLRKLNIDPAMFLGEVAVAERHYEAFTQVVAQYNRRASPPRFPVLIKRFRPIPEQTLVVLVEFLAPEDIWGLARCWERALTDGTVTQLRRAQEGGWEPAFTDGAAGVPTGTAAAENEQLRQQLEAAQLVNQRMVDQDLDLLQKSIDLNAAYYDLRHSYLAALEQFAALRPDELNDEYRAHLTATAERLRQSRPQAAAGSKEGGPRNG